MKSCRRESKYYRSIGSFRQSSRIFRLVGFHQLVLKTQAWIQLSTTNTEKSVHMTSGAILLTQYMYTSSLPPCDTMSHSFGINHQFMFSTGGLQHYYTIHVHVHHNDQQFTVHTHVHVNGSTCSWLSHKTLINLPIWAWWNRLIEWKGFGGTLQWGIQPTANQTRYIIQSNLHWSLSLLASVMRHVLWQRKSDMWSTASNLHCTYLQRRGLARHYHTKGKYMWPKFTSKWSAPILAPPTIRRSELTTLTMRFGC